MRKTAITFLLGLAIVATPALAQKVTIDYAQDFDFSGVETFTFVDTPDTNVGNNLEDGRIRAAILSELREGGLEQVDSDGDIEVTYHVTTDENTVLNTTTYGYGGWGPGWGRWGWAGGVGMGGATTTASTYVEGTLVIDAYDPGEEHLVWRGTGTVTVKEDPQKRSKQIDNILKKLGKRWEKILKNKGK